MTRQLSAFLRRFPVFVRLPYRVYSRMQARYTIGVAAVVKDDRGRILLVEHSYHPRYPWGLPGGWIGHDEDPAAAVTRELMEELQLEVDVIRLIHISKTLRNHIDLAFLCKARRPVGKLSHELLDYAWVSCDELPEITRFHRQSIEAAHV